MTRYGGKTENNINYLKERWKCKIYLFQKVTDCNNHKINFDWNVNGRINFKFILVGLMFSQKYHFEL